MGHRSIFFKIPDRILIGPLPVLGFDMHSMGVWRGENILIRSFNQLRGLVRTTLPE